MELERKTKILESKPPVKRKRNKERAKIVIGPENRRRNSKFVDMAQRYKEIGDNNRLGGKHFHIIYNTEDLTLNIFYSFVQELDKIERIIVKEEMGNIDGFVSLKEEVNIESQYFSIENMRYIPQCKRIISPHHYISYFLHKHKEKDWKCWLFSGGQRTSFPGLNKNINCRVDEYRIQTNEEYFEILRLISGYKCSPNTTPKKREFPDSNLSHSSPSQKNIKHSLERKIGYDADCELEDSGLSPIETSASDPQPLQSKITTPPATPMITMKDYQTLFSQVQLLREKVFLLENYNGKTN